MREAAALASNPSAIVHAQRFGTAGAWVGVGLCLAASVAAGMRWLRVAQREHYLPGSVLRFAGRWWLTSPLDGALGAVAVAAAVTAWWWPLAAVVAAAVVAVGPIGLGIRGRTAVLRWTRRLRTLAAVWVVLTAAVVVAGWLLGLAPVTAAGVAILTPLVVDAAVALVAPVEQRLAGRHVGRAAARLDRIRPTVVAITGSFGKTSTKNHVAQLVGPSRLLVASPASFNNRAGLARTVNENLADGTEVFVAEMGTYGVGEIAELCRWCPPDVAVITAVGPVHLERFGSEDRILEAKSEIIVGAGTVVLPVDDDRLAALAERTAAAGVRVVRCSAVDRDADVFVERTDAQAVPSLSVYRSGEPVAKDVPMAAGVQPSNLACAIGVALALGLDIRTITERLPAVQTADHRLSVARAPSGVMVVDDTYNANPKGTEVALDALISAADIKASSAREDAPARSAADPAAAADPADPADPAATAATADPAAGVSPAHRLVVVTPGMVELGRRQFDENRRFGAAVAGRATDLIVVGRTNRRALLAGARSVDRPGFEVRWVRHRDAAVAWVRQHLGPGDAVLYENDLPDHYP